MLTKNMESLSILKEIAQKLMVTTSWAKDGLKDTNALMKLECCGAILALERPLKESVMNLKWLQNSKWDAIKVKKLKRLLKISEPFLSK